MGRVESIAAEQYADSGFLSTGPRLVQNGALGVSGMQLLEIPLEHEHEFLLRPRQQLPAGRCLIHVDTEREIDALQNG
jgi:hypothetical protein